MTNNGFDSTKVQMIKNWNWPPKTHEFKRFDEKYKSPRIDDLTAIPKLKPE